ncbi:MAG: hypothetical protein RBU29_03355 [bacterium]|nr:hypothetical protein [bacterium]
MKIGVIEVNMDTDSLREDEFAQLEEFTRELNGEETAQDRKPKSSGETAQQLDKKNYSDYILQRVASGKFAQEAVRDVVFDSIKEYYIGVPEGCTLESGDITRTIHEKRAELYQMLESMNENLAGKNMEEVAATFSSLLDIQSQLCMQKTDGVISVRTRLCHFFPSNNTKQPPPLLRQELTLIFSPEEIHAIRAKLVDMADSDPLKSFFTTILEQAYDAVQYNELSGYLLLEMTQFFLNKLRINGYSDTTKFAEFSERFERAKQSLERAIDELREANQVINSHFLERPILMELPKLLRLLIQIKLGLLDPKNTRKILEQIQARLGSYARARSTVSFDFNRLPSYQHGVHLRQSIILNLQKDVLKYTGQVFEQELANVKDDLARMMEEIESASSVLNPNSPEYAELLQKKERIQRKLEEQRRKLDIVKSQEQLVNVQHQMVGQAIKRHQQGDGSLKKIEEKIQDAAKVDESKLRSMPDATGVKTSRMVHLQRKR